MTKHRYLIRRYLNWTWLTAEVQHATLTPRRDAMASSEEGGWQRPRPRPSSAWRPTPPQPPGGGGAAPGTPPCDPCRGTLRHHRRDGQCCDKCCYDSLRPRCGGGGSQGALRPTPGARWASIAVQTLSDCFVRCYRGGSATTAVKRRQCFSTMSLLLMLLMAAVVGAEAKSGECFH